jgi:hypothetical protein
MSSRIRGLISFLFAVVWPLVWRHYAPELLRSVLYEKLIHMMSPWVGVIFPYLLEYGPSAALAILGFYLFFRSKTPAAAVSASSEAKVVEGEVQPDAGPTRSTSGIINVLSTPINPRSLFVWIGTIGAACLVAWLYFVLVPAPSPSPAPAPTAVVGPAPAAAPRSTLASSCEQVGEKPEALPWTYVNRTSYLGRCVKVSHSLATVELNKEFPGDRKKYHIAQLDAPWAVFLLFDPSKWPTAPKKGEKFTGLCRIYQYQGTLEKRNGISLMPVYLSDCEQSS